MSDIAIKVENISKRYRIGLKEELHDTFFGALASWVKYPLSNFRRVQKLSKFGENGDFEDIVWAVKDVSFEVNRGEVLGIIGRNGAGKTTLLKILCRVTEPTSGSASIHGRVASLLEVGTGFHGELTGRENVFLNGTILGMNKKEIVRKFDEIVDFSGVEKFIDTPVKRYSSGMHVRLAFAVAAHLDPEIILIDEVLAVGDVEFQKKCLGKMKDISGEGRTVLFVSHNMGAVSSLCNRGFLLDKGKIITSGDIGSVISTYLQGAEDLPKSDSIIDHPNRAEGFKQLLTNFVLEAEKGVAYYGKPLLFRIGYKFPERIAVAQFCISFHNAHGVTAFTLISDYQTNDIPGSLQGDGEIICRIKSLPLLPGSYSVSLRLWQPGQKLDDIENVARFRVEWLNRDVGQFNWDSGMGVVYVDADWHWSGHDKG